MSRISRFSDIINNFDRFHFHILGCGAIGSSAATQLARSGAESFTLYDYDKVSNANVGVSQYNIPDIGKHKVDVLESYLKKFVMILWFSLVKISLINTILMVMI